MNIIKIKVYRLCFFGVLMSMFVSSCYEDPFYECKIIALDTNEVRVAGAHVVLIAPITPPDTGGEGITNINGEVDFEFPLEVVYEVFVSDTSQEHGVRRGKGTMKTAPDEKVVERITIK